MLNERIRNQTLILNHQKRNRFKHVVKPIKIIVKSRRNKEKIRSETKLFNHANILNTNFIFAYPARMNSKSKAVTKKSLQSVQDDKQILDQDVRSAKPLEVRKGLRKGRRPIVIRSQ